MALARALAVEPLLLLLDEPFGALDAQVRRELRTWLRDLHEQSGVTTVLVTHDQEEAMEIADNIAIILLGRVAQDGSPAECYEHPNNDFVVTFLGPATKLDGKWIRLHDIEISRNHSGHEAKGSIRRIVQLGFEVRVEVTFDNGTEVPVQLARRTFDELAPQVGETVFIGSGNNIDEPAPTVTI